MTDKDKKTLREEGVEHGKPVKPSPGNHPQTLDAPPQGPEPPPPPPPPTNDEPIG